MSSILLIDHIYAVLLLGIFLIAVFKSQPQLKDAKLDTSDKLAFYWSNSLFLYWIAGLAVLYWWLAGRDFQSLGFRWPRSESMLACSGLIALYATFYGFHMWLKLGTKQRFEKTRETWRRLTPFLPATRTEVMHGLQLAFCAGVTEEIVFRGYLINYFTALFAGQQLFDPAEPAAWWAVAIGVSVPAVLFAAWHRYSGWSNVFHIAWSSIVFGLIFVLSQSLLIVMVLHVTIDVIANLISPWILGEETGGDQDADVDQIDQSSISSVSS